MIRPLSLTGMVLLLAVISACFLNPLQAQGNVKWKNSMEPSSSIQIGDTVEFIFSASIPKGYHIYSAKPTPQEGPLVTTVTFENLKGLELSGDLLERDGELHTAYDEIFETDVYEYYDKVTFYQRAVVTKKNIEASGLLDYGICNDIGCMPGSNEFSFSVKVKK